MNGGPAPPPAERPGPVARLFGSLATALLDLGLDAIRGWLRERLGPGADVAAITTDGALVHLEGVRVPIGPRGVLVLDRATAKVSALGRAGLPEMQVRAFSGRVTFGDPPELRAELRFTAFAEPPPEAWISGELAITDTSWSPRTRAAPARPLEGRASLLVSSRGFRLDDGALHGEVVRARFDAAGTFDDDGREPLPGGLAPAGIERASLVLAHARVGAFLDAASALSGRSFRGEMPAFAPLDAQLHGALRFSREDGGAVDLRIASDAIAAEIRGRVGSDGSDLDVEVTAAVRPASLLRAANVPPAILPRDDDALRVLLRVSGDVRRPAVNGTVAAGQLGLRLGRPRFVPAVVLTDLAGDLYLRDERAVVAGSVRAGRRAIAFDIDANVRRAAARVTLRADVLDAPFLREVARTLGVGAPLPHDTTAGFELTVAPGAAGPAVAGTLTVATPRSSVAITLTAADRGRLTGRVAAADVAALGGPVRALEGSVTIACDLIRGETGWALAGELASPRVVLALAARPAAPSWVLEDVRAQVSADRAAVVFGDLAFVACGGRFVASGTIPIAEAGTPAAPRLALVLERGGAELAGRIVEVLAEGSRLAVPAEVVGRGVLRLDPGGRLVSDVTLETPAGTALRLRVELDAGHVDGTAAVGTIALSDVLPSLRIAIPGLRDLATAEGVVAIGAELRGRPGERVVLGTVAAERTRIVAAGGAVEISALRAMVRVDRHAVAWNGLEAAILDGAVTSAGVVGRGGAVLGRVAMRRVAVHDVPGALVGAASGALGEIVRGRLSGAVAARSEGDGTALLTGELTLDEAAFPVLARVRPALARYGLRPPDEDARAPVTASLLGDERGLALRSVVIELRGASVRGEIDVTRGRELDGRAEVTVAEAYLRTSKVLTLPRVLSERLVLPVTVSGSLDAPRIHADPASLLGRFLRDNRMTALVTSALGREPPPPADPGAPRASSAIDAELARRIDAYAADWIHVTERRSGFFSAAAPGERPRGR